MEVDRDESMKYYKPSEMYMGRWLLFVVVGMVQGFIVCLGDIFLPGAQVVEPVRMVILGVVCSFVYVNIIYALSLTFKHIGKALCVILVILQIPGSSGTYPVEMAPVFSRMCIRSCLLPMVSGPCVNVLQDYMAIPI